MLWSINIYINSYVPLHPANCSIERSNEQCWGWRWRWRCYYYAYSSASIVDELVPSRLGWSRIYKVVKISTNTKDSPRVQLLPRVADLQNETNRIDFIGYEIFMSFQRPEEVDHILWDPLVWLRNCIYCHNWETTSWGWISLGRSYLPASIWDEDFEGIQGRVDKAWIWLSL